MNIFFHIGVFAPLLPALVTFVYWSQYTTMKRWFSAMIWTIAVHSTASYTYALTFQSNNMPFFHVYILMECLFLLVLFHLMQSRKESRTSWILLGAGFTLIWLYNIFWGDGIWGYPSYIHALEALLLIGCSLHWFAQLLREKKVKNPIRTFGFWTSTGVLIYFSGNLVLFFFSTFVAQQSGPVFDAIWGVHAILSILLYLIYTVAVLWGSKKVESS